MAYNIETVTSRTLLCILFLALSAVPVAMAHPHEDHVIQAEVDKLHALFDREWERAMQQHPTFASMLGDRRYNDSWTDMSLDAIAMRHEQSTAALSDLRDVDRQVLPDNEKLNYDLFERQLQQQLEGHEFQTYLIPLTQRGGIQTRDEIARSLPFQTAEDYRDWLERLRGVDTLVEQNISLMKRGMEEGIVPAHITMQRVPRQIEAQLVDEATESPFYGPFERMPESIDEQLRKEFRSEAESVIEEEVVPAYRAFHRFFTESYLPATRQEAGVWALPDGDEYYSWAVHHHTTTEMTPTEIHKLGKSEVKRIREEMQKVIEKTDFEGTFDEFLEFLRTDPQFYYEDPDELLEAYRATSKKIDPELVKLFRGLPRVPYGVEPIPDAIAPDTTTAYYQPPAADGSRAGTYYVNLYKPTSRPKYEIEVLSVHEAVPGHHLQIAIAQELEELPKFRRYGGRVTAFVEGWGLYSESLGEELGLYEDPYSKFGQLTYEMWRAVRLVVDTGIHHMKWDRQQAIDYFKTYAAKTEHDITNEVDRYIAWPGQALAYKIGELKIKELREKASSKLGEAFDIKDFHDVVLRQGAVPLDVLERRVNEYIERTSTTASKQ